MVVAVNERGEKLVMSIGTLKSLIQHGGRHKVSNQTSNRRELASGSRVICVSTPMARIKKGRISLISMEHKFGS